MSFRKNKGVTDGYGILVEERDMSYVLVNDVSRDRPFYDATEDTAQLIYPTAAAQRLVS